MVLTDCEIIEAECIFLLIDNGIVSNDICNEFMTSVYHKNPEMFALLDWMLMRRFYSESISFIYRHEEQNHKV
jgi:hypothetical protein